MGKGESYQYYHRVLEVKLVSPQGLSFSVASEFIANTDGHQKQDCELKAFYRLAPRLKAMFPQLKITLLGDGIYSNGPVLALCRELKWHFIFVLQDDSLKTLWQDYEGLHSMPANALGVCEDYQGFCKGELLYRWQNDLDYQGKNFKGKLNLMDVLKLKKETGAYERTRAFLTSYHLSRGFVETLEHTGQQRWKIENQGFDIQKHHGYALEHVYCQQFNAMKVVYLLIQIAHLLNQLVYHTDIFRICREFKCLKTYFKHLQTALTSEWTASWEYQWLEVSSQGYQFRWNF